MYEIERIGQKQGDIFLFRGEKHVTSTGHGRRWVDLTRLQIRKGLTMPPEISVSEKEEQEFTTFLQEKIRRYNCDHSPYHRQAQQPGALTPLNLILRDDSGRMVGGLTANSYWDWLEIEHFYLPERLRGGGMGRAMLQTAETIARKRGCQHCFLTTYDFQARLFYEKQGYFVVGRLDGYPPNSTYYWMRKALSSAP